MGPLFRLNLESGFLIWVKDGSRKFFKHIEVKILCTEVKNISIEPENERI